MSNDQWTVLGLLGGLFALELLRLPSVKKWLVNGMKTIQGAVNPGGQKNG